LNFAEFLAVNTMYKGTQWFLTLLEGGVRKDLFALNKLYLLSTKEFNRF
jgi:hypothetical protein